MAGVALSGIRAMAGGITAMADTQENELEMQWYQEEHTHRMQNKAWHAEDMRFKELEKVWRDVDSKRSRLTQISGQLESLARLSSYMCLAEMTIYVNQSLPAATEWRLSEVLMCIWGIMCVTTVVIHLNLMVIASIIHISVLQVSVHEGPEDTITDAEQYKLDGSNPEGIIMHPQQFIHLWEARYDKWYRRLVRAFSASVALFFALLAPLAHVKFYVSPPAAWCFTAVCCLGILIWARFNESMVSYLLYRGNSGAIRMQARSPSRPSLTAETASSPAWSHIPPPTPTPAQQAARQGAAGRPYFIGFWS